MIHIAICEDDTKYLAHLRDILCRTKILCDITEYTCAEPLLLDLETGRNLTFVNGKMVFRVNV